MGTDSGAGNSEDSALLLVSLFAELPEDPTAEAELAQELATAGVQSSNEDEKSALMDLLQIIPPRPIPTDAATQLGQT